MSLNKRLFMVSNKNHNYTHIVNLEHLVIKIFFGTFYAILNISV